MHPLGALTFKMCFIDVLRLAILSIYSAVSIELSSDELRRNHRKFAGLTLAYF